jgi:hypothetical protein
VVHLSTGTDRHLITVDILFQIANTSLGLGQDHVTYPPPIFELGLMPHPLVCIRSVLGLGVSNPIAQVPQWLMSLLTIPSLRPKAGQGGLNGRELSVVIRLVALLDHVSRLIYVPNHSVEFANGVFGRVIAH